MGGSLEELLLFTGTPVGRPRGHADEYVVRRVGVKESTTKLYKVKGGVQKSRLGVTEGPPRAPVLAPDW